MKGELSMVNYKIFSIDGYDKDIVFLNTIEDLYFLKQEIFAKLSEKYGSKFNVIVDHFITNGFSFNRFSLLIFNGEENSSSYIINPREIPEEVKKSIILYLKENLDILEESSLPISIKEFIKQDN